MQNAIPLHLLHETQRAKEICRLRAYAKSEQYKGLPDFWTGATPNGEVVPLRERAPCVIYPLPKIATNRVVDFCFGETRFPTLTVPETKDGAVYGLKLSEAEAESLTSGLADLAKHAHLRSVLVRMMRRGLQQRTAVAIFSIRDGHYHVELPSPDHCQPIFAGDDPEREVLSLSWVYQYDAEVYDAKLRQVRTQRFWFRRDVTALDVVEYAPTKVETDHTKPPTWTEQRRTPHGFGFCPVLWVRNVPEECSHLDGQALLEGCLNECDALNFAYSQRHRGITFFGTPQPWETGVQDEDGPEAKERTARGYSPDTQQPGPYGGMAPKAARATAPDRIWSYEGENVKLGLLETTGMAFQVATDHVNDIRQRISEAVSIVLADPDAAKGMGDLNAKLLAMLYAPMLSLVDSLRDETWWPALQSVVSMMLRMLVALDGKGVLIPNAEALAKLLKRFQVTTADSQTRWVCPPIEAVWGDSFAPSNTEIGEGIRAAVEAKEAGLITTKTAASYVASYFGVTKPDQEVEEAQEEADERAAKAQAVFDAQNAVDPDADGDTPPGAEPRAPQTQE